ncbi:Swarming motility protein YbiA [Laceyella sacchari]|nr:Swarming motility protein YbiA [Laceyella sacchari]
MAPRGGEHFGIGCPVCRLFLVYTGSQNTKLKGGAAVVITFYRVNDPYGCFSNFSAHPIVLDGKEWPTTEHYFQAQKFVTTAPDYAEKIRLAPSPMKAAQWGRSRKAPLRPDWELVKDDVMRRAVYAKFKSHPEIRDVLLATGEEKIVELTTTDMYWGVGSDGTGKNRLGVILMEVRERLRQELT